MSVPGDEKEKNLLPMVIFKWTVLEEQKQNGINMVKFEKF